MVKKVPVASLVGSRVFDTKGAAEKYAVAERARKAQSGYRTRYEIDLDPQTGKFRVREFIYNTDSKGNLA